MDEHIVSWAQEYGKVTIFSFMIYGPFTEQHNLLIMSGLGYLLVGLDEKMELMSNCEEVGEERARMMNAFQGTNLHIIAPTSREDLENHIKGVVLDGLRFCRLKAEYLNCVVVNDLV
jgi:hypothetical protein